MFPSAPAHKRSVHTRVSACASDSERAALERDIYQQEDRASLAKTILEPCASCCTLTTLLIGLEFLPQSVDILASFRCEAIDKRLQLFARSLAKIFRTTDV